MDPYLGGLSSDISYYRHIYDPLVLPSETLQPQPTLATDWRLIDPLTWEFELRKNVRFHDGTPFDANDVVFSFKRIGTVEGSDGLVADYAAPIKDVQVLNPHRIRLVTQSPTPHLIRNLMFLSIISDSIDPDSTTEDFNSGKAAIGTGPFKLVEWKRGTELVLARNDNDWRPPVAFERTVIKEMTNNAARVAAIQAGDVDMIDTVPPLDAGRLTAMESIDLWVAPASRVIFIGALQRDEIAPMTWAKDGQALKVNPFRDIRVRRALNLAIDRDLIVERVMEKLAFKASQGVPEGFLGHDPDIPMPEHDPERARALLAEAGYGDGFKTVLACPNDRYINDQTICQAIGQMWNRIGLAVDIETMPKAVYFGRMLKGEFPTYMLGWGNSMGNSISFLNNVIGTRDISKGRGSWNPSYSDPMLDELIGRGISEMDTDTRTRLLKEAMADAVADLAFFPLHVQPTVFATRSGWRFTPLADETVNTASLRPGE